MISGKKKKEIKIYNESWYALDHKNPKATLKLKSY